MKKQFIYRIPKPLLVILIVIFSLVLVLDVANFILTPEQQSFPSGMPDFSAMNFSGERPSTDTESDSSASDTGSMPAFDAGNMPSGASGERPSFDASSMPQGAQSGSMPAFDASNMPQGMPSGSSSGETSSEASSETAEEQTTDSSRPSFDPSQFQTSTQTSLRTRIRNAFVPIAIVALLLDLVCITLLTLRKLHDMENEPEVEEKEEEELLNEDEPPKRGINRSVLVSVLCIILIIVLIVSSLPKSSEDNTTVEKKLITGTPTENVLTDVITGAGTLTPGKTKGVELPNLIDVDKYYVRNGDAVKAGDILASVDTVDVEAAITDLMAVLKTLDSDLNTQQSKTGSTYIQSTISGRVKAIYGATGDDVVTTVYENGCLVLLSADGRMCVRFTSAVSVPEGKTVTVTFADGSVLQGFVEGTDEEGITTVTMDDATAMPGDAVTVTDAEGTLLGSGELEIHYPVRVSGYYGTVDKIYAKLNQTVSNGTTLLSLKNVGNTVSFNELHSRRQELEQQMERLFKIRDGYLRAEEDGIISDIPSDAEYASEEEITAVKQLAYDAAAEEAYLAKLLAAFEPGYQLVLLSDKVPVSGTEGGSVPSGTMPEGGMPSGSVPGGEGSADEPAKDKIYVTGTILSIDEEKGTITIQIETTTSESISSIITVQYDDVTKVAVGDYVSITLDVSGTTMVAEQIEKTEKQQDTPGQGSMPSGMSGMGGMSGYSSASTAKSYDTYDDSTYVILNLIPQDELAVVITIDELDILQLKNGMDAQVTLDAFKGRVFDGVITEISTEGSNDGGNTKYEVEVTITSTDQMLSGMNASVRIVTGESEPVLTVPAAALSEEGGRTYIYTGCDEKNETLTNPVEVTTGISDGENVEITSGIAAGDTYYYYYAGDVQYNFV